MVCLGERVCLEPLVAWRGIGDFGGRGELSIAWRDIIGGTQVPPAFSGSLARPGPGLFVFRLRCEGSRQELSVCLAGMTSIIAREFLRREAGRHIQKS